MAARLIEEDPELAHQHALAASRRAGRVAVVRESVAITAYAMGDFALALRELRTYRRISGNDDQIALIVDSERGMGRPDKALEEARTVDRAALPTATRVALAIAMSGARLDRGETELALGELEIPELDPDVAFDWSPALFSARAAVLEDLGRSEEAEFWQERAEVASAALGHGEDDEIVIEDVFEDLPDDERGDAADDDADADAVDDGAPDTTPETGAPDDDAGADAADDGAPDAPAPETGSPEAADTGDGSEGPSAGEEPTSSQESAE